MKKVIFNADDLGLSKGINRGILKACKRGVITSVSLMAGHKESLSGAKLFKDNPKISLGLHFEIDKQEVKYLEDSKGNISTKIVKDIEQKFLEQVEIFKKIVGRMPDHIDGHHHAHILPPIGKIISAYCQRNKIKLRGQVRHIDSFFGQHAKELPSTKKLIEILKNLPNGISEIMFHPGFVTSDLKSSYLKGRELELIALTSPKVKQAIKDLGIEAISWRDV